MKRGALILLTGLLVSAAAFAGFFYFGTRSGRALMSQPEPELAWLKKEFHLSDAEFDRIARLHDAYLPECAQRCSRIAAQNRQIEQLLARVPSITTEVRDLLAERARMRADCEAEMLNHFLEVSRTMPPEQGRRYLDWVEKQTFLNSQGMEQRHQSMEGHHH